MAERRAGAKGRRIGSSRRRQLREGSGETPAMTAPGEEPPWAPERASREQDKDQAGSVTRSDVQKLQEEDIPQSTPELELVFDGLDAAGLAGQLQSSQQATRDHRRRKTASRRVRLVLPDPALEGVDSEERRHFAAFMDQLGTDNTSEEREIWQLWVKLRQDEPQLLGSLEDFLAKMRHRIQEAKSKKEALEVALNRRVAEHDKEVQQLCEALEQQVQQEGLARSHKRSTELRRALEASEREVQRLATAQVELERRCHSLRSTWQATSTQNRQLEETNRVLEEHLEHLYRQLQQSHGRLWTARAVVARELMEEPGDREVAELPSEAPMSPQSPEKSEKYRSDTWIRLGSQSGEPKAGSTHQVVWEVLPAEINPSGAPLRASFVEEDPSSEFLKEERVSDQSSLLREMNDAIAALSKHLKPQAVGAPPTPAGVAHQPRHDAEPQMGLEAGTTHGTTPGVLQETLPSPVGHKLLEGDLKEGPAAAKLHAPDVTQAGASVGARRRRAQEQRAEKGESPEETQRMLFLQGKDAGVKELMLKLSEHLQGALGESMAAGEQVLMEVEGKGWMQEKTGWEKAQLPGEAEEVALSEGKNAEAGLGPPEAGVASLAAGWQLGPTAAPGEHAQPLDTGLRGEPESLSGLSEKLEIEPGEHLELESPAQGEALTGAAQGEGVLPEVTEGPGLGMQEEGYVREAEPQPQDESAMGNPAWGGSVGVEVTPADVWEGEVGTDVQLLEPQGSDTDMQLLAEVEAALQPPSEVGYPGTELGRSVAPDVQPLQEEDKSESGLGEERGAAVAHGEGPCPADTPAGSPALCGVFPVKPQAPEQVEAEDAQIERQLYGGVSTENPQGGEGGAAVHLEEEAEDRGQGQGEHGLPQEPVLGLQGAEVSQGEGAGADVHPPEKAAILDTLEDQGTDANVQPHAEVEELELSPGGSTEADLQLSSETSSSDTEQGGSVCPDVQPLDQVDTMESVELVEAEDPQADTELWWSASPEISHREGDHADVHLEEEAEDRGQGQGEHGLPREPVLDLQGEQAGVDVHPPAEAAILDTLEDQGIDANVQLLAETHKLKLSPGGSAEADLQLLSEASSSGSEQGGSMCPDVQPLDQLDTMESVELVDAEGPQADTELWWGLSPEIPHRGGDCADVYLEEEAEDSGQGQGEHGLPHKPSLHTQEDIKPREGAGADMQPPAEAAILDTLEDQGTDVNVQPHAEVGELKLSPRGNTEADLQLSSEASSSGTEQGRSVAPDVQPLDQVDEPELVEMEVEDAQTEMQLCEGLSPEASWGRGGVAVVQLVEEAEDWGQGQGDRGLLHEPVLDQEGAGVGPGEGAGTDMQPPEEAALLDTLEDQGTDTNVQPHAEVEELKLSPGGNTEADLQLLSEASSSDTEQGRSVAPDIQSSDQVDEPELVEMEVEDAQTEMQLCEGLSPEAPWGGEGVAVMQLVEEAEDWGQGQGDHGLLHELVLDRQGAGVGTDQHGAGTGVHPPAEAAILDKLEDQGTDANVQPHAEVEELKLSPGGSTEADLASLGAGGMREGEQSQAPGLEAAHTAYPWEGAAGALLSPPAGSTLHPECVTPTEGPGLGLKLGAFTGPDGQILEDSQMLETPQGESADAEERPLDGAQGVEVVQGERLEAGVRSLVETQSLGIKQGDEDGVSALAPLASEVTLQISTLKLHTMMQEDVLVPDTQRLGASGQAAQSEVEEEVSARADQVRLHAASQQPEEKPQHVMEMEQVAAGPAETPKQEVPPASTLHTRVQQEEDAGNGQSGMVLRDSSLGDAANSSVQPQRQLLGEQSKDFSAGQHEKQQEVGRKMSQEGKPSPGEPGAAAADGAGAVSRGSPEASLDPDHLYNVLFIGDSHVGKTSFLYRLHADTFNPHLTATVGLDYQVKNIIVDNKRFALRLWDSAGQERYRSVTKQFFRKADGVVLMYDITSERSFADVRYWLSCVQEGAEDRVPVLLLGNKTDCAAERQVPTKEGERLAKEHQLMFYECSAASGHNVSESMVSLIRLLKDHEDELKNKAEEVPKPPQKKNGCCW